MRQASFLKEVGAGIGWSFQSGAAQWAECSEFVLSPGKFAASAI